MSRTLQQKTIGRLAAPPTPVVAPVRAVVRAVPQLAGGLRVSSPSDPAEKEAESTARKILRMQASPAHARPRRFASPYAARFAHLPIGRAATMVARRDEGQPDVAANLNAELAAIQSSGRPLPHNVLRFMEPRFRADLSQVRIHTGENAARLSAGLGARAFTYSNQVYFGRDRFKPETEEGRELIAHELTHTIQQGATVQRSEDVTVTAQSQVHVQRSLLSRGLDMVAERANDIPGFRMFTIVIGLNPVNMSAVDRSPANILRAVIEFIPGGGLIRRALDNHGIIDKAANWIAQQIKTLGIVGGAIRDALVTFIEKLKLGDILSPSATWNRLKRIFTDPIDRIIAFAAGLVTGILELIKDAILRPLAGLAQGLPAYDLLKAVLQKDPVTGDPYPRTAETVIGGFMKLAGQGDVWEKMQQARAVPRAWAWFQRALGELIGFVREIPGLFIQALKSLQIADLILLPMAFVKVGKVFGGFVVRFISWAGTTVWNLLEIIFDVISPGALGYVKRTGAALKSILKNPLPFVGNLVKAAMLGFKNFAANFLDHLKAGLIDWLTGSLPGVYIPRAFTLAEIVKFVFSVLGLTWANIRQKLVAVVGDPAVKAMETGFDIVVTLVTQGPAAAWDKIKEQLANLKDMVIGGITDLVVDAVVKKAIPKLIAMFVPGAGFISAIISIYDTVMVFVQKISRIIQVVTAFINSIVAIAAGQIAAAAARVESILAGLLSLAISFLAGFAGLGNIASKIMGVIQKIRAPIDKALDWLVNWIVTMAKKLGKAFGAAASAAFNWGATKSGFSDEKGWTHSIYVQEGPSPRVLIASDPRAARDFLDWYVKQRGGDFGKDNNALIGQITGAIGKADSIARSIAAAQRTGTAPKDLERRMLAANVEISGLLSQLIGSDRSLGKLKEKYKLEGLTGTYGSMPKPPGDDFTADHQPQAAALEAAATFDFFTDDGELKKHAAGRARAGFAINVHKIRHMAGATYGSKGKATKEAFLGRLKSRLLRKRPAEQRKIVVAELRAELNRDVSAMKNVARANTTSGTWSDVMGISEIDLEAKKKLVTEVGGRIVSGEDQIAAQDLDSLTN